MTDRPASSEPRAPKYYGLKRHLEDLVRTMPAGSALPPERALSVQFSMSRTTVRQALHELVVEGRLDRVQGRGTFVARPRRLRTVPLRGWTDPPDPGGRPAATGRDNGPAGPDDGADEGSGNGSAPDTGAGPDAAPGPAGSLLGTEQVDADAELSEQLTVPRGARLIRVERVLRDETDPMAIQVSWLPARRFPGLLRRSQRGRAEIADIDAAIRAAFGGAAPLREARVETALATPREADLLGTEVGAPLLLVTEHLRDAAGAPVEWSQTRYRGDRFALLLPAG